MTDAVSSSRPSLPRRAAAGAWHVPAGFAFLLRRPALWPFAALPALLALLLTFVGLVVGIFAGPRLEARFGPAPGSVPVWVELPVGLLLWTATLGSCIFLGLGVAFVLVSPILERLSRQAEARARGRAADKGRGLG
ncbi:MAG TPA: EI24 domain-containing protein, partial [Vicinamibacteria bacterium]|nr:EI24 domain-containing protein [Vicinamibacteria bacterium]